MTKKWSEVATSPAFQALSADEQDQARRQYFDSIVAPRVPASDIDAARSQFMAASAKPADASIDAKMRGVPTYENTRPQGAPASPEPKDGFWGKVNGAVIETPLAVVSSMAGGLAGAVAGAGEYIRGGNYGTGDFRGANKVAKEVAELITYKPVTQTGREFVEKFGKAMTDSGLTGLPIGPELNAAARLAAPSAGQVSRGAAAAGNAVVEAAGPALDVARAIKDTKLRDLVNSKRQMAGVGAAMTDEAVLRTQRAADLPVPIDLTNAQRTRTFEAQRFERETAKLSKEGAPLRERYDLQNKQIEQNLDAFWDITNARSPNLRGVGEVVDRALANKRDAMKAETNALYAQARDAGEMLEPVNVDSLRKFIEANRSAEQKAPIIKAIESELNRLGATRAPTPTAAKPYGGKPETVLSLNDLETVRQLARELIEPGTPDAVFGTKLIRLMDEASDGKGGALYQQARRSYENYAKQFIDRGTINKMMRTKPGTTDRAVAFEDMYNEAILKGSLDDVRGVRRVLQTAGDEGAQAWAELQGQTIRDMKEKMFGNSARDSQGNAVGSPAALDKIVKNLDADGKLDFIFGKKGAQQIRDMNDLAKDIYTAPPGSVNTSNTASVLIGLLDTAVSGVSGVPLPIGTAINYGVKRVKSNAVQNQVAQALSPIGELPPAPTKLSERVARQRALRLQRVGQSQSIDEAIQAAGDDPD